ncbi:hypothetical protein BMR1_03g00450 [Babesia microti strain RI]|uniref:DUF4203 domain-containing protein n=1 Tax=Babesia microti (strain RI) TaxID=1133968 RepID=A0A1R4AB53_BABMR|nr:hypothetical protein BMR1_03g00450 [Babesia microti strain RI]SJK86238.1 hypothetical protein BMR1_03g00450 [Babesia microti strain RI]|eukprot:XP_021338421.1 hypothetical protein BMR1_03g00450 [Babesia microti strain RI]
MSIQLFGKLAIHIVLLTYPVTSLKITITKDSYENVKQIDAAIETKDDNLQNLRKQSDRNNEVEGIAPKLTPTTTLPTPLPPNAKPKSVNEEDIAEEIRKRIIKNLSAQSKRQIHSPNESVVRPITQTIASATNIAQPLTNRVVVDKAVDNRVIVIPKTKNFYSGNAKTISISIAICTFVLSIVVTCYLIYHTASLFSKGFYSTKFYKGGGTLMVFMAMEGNLFGLFLGWIVWHDLNTSISVAGPSMCLFVAVILLGPRGATLGGFGGFTLGFVFGNFICNSINSMVLWSTVGICCGSIIGFLPVFPSLKINQRYSRIIILEKN